MNIATGGSSTATLPASNTSTEVTLVASTDKAPTGGGQYFSVIGRQVNATNDYRAKVRTGVGGVVTLYLARTENGTETILKTTTVSGLTYNAGDKLRVRMQVSGTSPTTLQAKVWKDGTAEPTSWQSTGTDTTASLQAAGWWASTAMSVPARRTAQWRSHTTSSGLVRCVRELGGTALWRGFTGSNSRTFGDRRRKAARKQGAEHARSNIHPVDPQHRRVGRRRCDHRGRPGRSRTG